MLIFYLLSLNVILLIQQHTMEHIGVSKSVERLKPKVQKWLTEYLAQDPSMPHVFLWHFKHDVNQHNNITDMSDITIH